LLVNCNNSLFRRGGTIGISVDFANKLATVQELHGPNPVIQLPYLLTSLATTFMALEWQVVTMRKILEDIAGN
jgi:hypothetical protein